MLMIALRLASIFERRASDERSTHDRGTANLCKLAFAASAPFQIEGTVCPKRNSYEPSSVNDEIPQFCSDQYGTAIHNDHLPCAVSFLHKVKISLGKILSLAHAAD